MTDRVIVRTEARPLGWDELAPEKKQALQRALALLGAAAKEAAADTPRDRGADGDRRARVVVINGARGTGKTSLYLTLREYLRDPVHWRVEHEVGTLPDHIVWLETLDLEPLPEPSNLLAAVLTRIEQAISEMPVGWDGERGEPLASRRQPKDVHDAIQDLNRLQSDVSLAWDGNQLSRAGSLDPDCFAQEVRRAERVRLALNHRLRRALAPLSRSRFWDGRPAPALFVLPVDDIDLSPQHAMGLLRLLRTISVPQIFLLVLTDLGLLKDVAIFQRSGDLSRVTEFGRVATLPSNVERIASRSRELAYAALRKLLPPAQVIDLEPCTIAEALSIKPPEATRDLEQVLRDVPLCWWQGWWPRESRIKPPPDNLLEFLLPGFGSRKSQADSDATLHRQMSQLPLLAAAVAGTPRQVLDLWHLLADQGRRDPRSVAPAARAAHEIAWMRELTDLVVQETRRVIQEQHWLEVAAVEQLLRTMHEEHDGSWRIDLEHWTITTTSTVEVQLPLPSGARVRALAPRELRVGTTLAPSETRPAPKPQYLPRHDGAWLMLLHDLVRWGYHAGQVTGRGQEAGLLDPSPSLVQVEPEAWPAPAHAATLEWPHVLFRSFRDLDSFARIWGAVLEDWQRSPGFASREMDRDHAVGSLAVAWMAANTTCLRREDAETLSVDEDYQPALGILLDRLNELADASTSARYQTDDLWATHRWLIEVPALLTPEMGIPPRLAEFFWAEVTNGRTNRSGLNAFYGSPQRTRNIRMRRLDALYKIYATGDIEATIRLGARGRPRHSAPTAVTSRRLQDVATKHRANTQYRGAMRPTFAELDELAKRARPERR